jgi:hypothetical protein
MLAPCPEQGAALRRFGVLRAEGLPMLAAQWLVQHDSPALRELAGLSGSEGWLIDQLWPAVLSDLGVETQSDDEAWFQLAAYEVSAMRYGREVLEAMNEVVHAYIHAGYPNQDEVSFIYSLDDELDGGWGRPKDEVLAEVRRTLDSWASRGEDA